jgi:hypothetical protein
LETHRKNLIFVVVNLIYLIPGTVCSFFYFNHFYDIWEINITMPHLLGNVIGFVFLIPYALFYLMALTFIILLHPIVILILFIVNLYKKYISINNINFIIVFIWSIIIALVYLILIWGKGLYLTV